MAVTVRAPRHAPLPKIKQILSKRAPWILRQQEFFLAFYPKQTPKNYVSGESHLYLGRQYRLKLIRSRKESVKLDGGHLVVRCRSQARGRWLVKQWYLERATDKFALYSLKWIRRFKRYGKTPSAVTIRHMAKRWGSCTPNGKIILNAELIKAPKACIEYVIIHELCHLIHRNHTSRFVKLQRELMPEWEKWKTALEKLLA